jgi:hypothetical protein
MYTEFWLEKQQQRPLGKPRRWHEDNIGMDLREITSQVVELLHMAQDRIQWRVFVNTATDLRIL